MTTRSPGSVALQLKCLDITFSWTDRSCASLSLCVCVFVSVWKCACVCTDFLVCCHVTVRLHHWLFVPLHHCHQIAPSLSIPISERFDPQRRISNIFHCALNFDLGSTLSHIWDMFQNRDTYVSHPRLGLRACVCVCVCLGLCRLPHNQK